MIGYLTVHGPVSDGTACDVTAVAADGWDRLIAGTGFRFVRELSRVWHDNLGDIDCVNGPGWHITAEFEVSA